MNIKEKLLSAVGEVDVSDTGLDTLVDILVGKIKAQEKRIKELCSENHKEKQRLQDEIEAARKIDRII